MLQSTRHSIGRYTEKAVDLEDAVRVSSSFCRVSAEEKEKRRKCSRRRKGMLKPGIFSDNPRKLEGMQGMPNFPYEQLGVYYWNCTVACVQNRD